MNLFSKILRKYTYHWFYGSVIDIQQKVEDIEVIRKYVREISPPHCYVEIGTCQSGSALIAKTAIKEGVQIYTIDPNDNRYNFKERVKADKLDKELGIHFLIILLWRSLKTGINQSECYLSTETTQKPERTLKRGRSL